MLCDPEKCTGCGACAAKCPHRAIQMCLNEEGFYQPALDPALCIQCGACTQACPVLNRREDPAYRPIAFAAKIMDADILRQSASGGMFTALAHEILRRGGAVFGAAWQGRQAVHRCACSDEELSVMRGSKYVQSDAAQTYPRVRELLRSGRPVLFTGVPCQIAGLYGYLGKDDPNLYTVDIVCHGGGSPRMLEEHLQNLEKAENAALTALNHTDKTKSAWNVLIQKTIRMQFDNGTVRYMDSSEDPYLSLFLNRFIYRQACYGCPFARLPRVADITLGDFFGFGSFWRHRLDTAGGISAVLLNTPKGAQMFSALTQSGTIDSEPANLWECLLYNTNIWRPYPKHPQREEVFKTYREKGFSAVDQRYYQTSQNRGSRFVRRIIKRILGPLNTARGMGIVYGLRNRKAIQTVLTALPEKTPETE